MDLILFVVRILLACVFLVSATAKAVDRSGSAEAARGFGLPSRWAPSVGRALPVLELSLAALLVIPATAAGAAMASVAFLLAMSAVVAVALLRGRKVICHCFGQLSAGETISWKLIARNLALAAMAAFAVLESHAAGPISRWSWLRGSPPIAVVGVVLAAVIATLLSVLILVVVQLIRMNGRILLRLDALEAGGPAAAGATRAVVPASGLPIGNPAPSFALPDLNGQLVTLQAVLARAARTVLVFVDPGCGPCRRLLPELGQWQQDLRKQITVVVVSQGAADANQAAAAEHGLSEVLLQKDFQVATDYRAAGTPTAVIITAEGMVGSQVASGADEIRDLLRDGLSGRGGRRQLPLVGSRQEYVPSADNEVGASLTSA